MNRHLVTFALAALVAHWAEKRKLYCARWVRQVMEHAYPGLPCVPPSGLDAWQQYQWFKESGYDVPLSHGSVIGDILYKKPTKRNPYGHVGIRVPGNLVAENSTVHARDDFDDARGQRTLEEFGHYDAIVRIPLGGK